MFDSNQGKGLTRKINYFLAVSNCDVVPNEMMSHVDKQVYDRGVGKLQVKDENAKNAKSSTTATS